MEQSNRSRSSIILVSSSAANSDIDVFCGSQAVDLQILLCPVYFNGYNESLLSLNSEHNKPQCKGTPDWTADPPVVRFNFNITEEAITACSSKLTVGHLPQSPSVDHRIQYLCLQSTHKTNLSCLFSKGQSGGRNRAVFGFFDRPVHQHLRHDLLQGPHHRGHHLSPRGDVLLLLPLPSAVPGQQHSDEHVSDTRTECKELCSNPNLYCVNKCRSTFFRLKRTRVHVSDT